MMFRKIFFTTTIIINIVVFAFAGNNNREVQSKYFPLNMSKESRFFATPDELKDKFEINIDNFSVKKVYNRKRRYTALMDNTFDANILSKPLIKQLKSIDTLYAHPNFISVIKFPVSIKINSAKTSMSMKDFSYSQNLLTFSPKKTAKIGNIVLTAFDNKTKRNKVFNFIVKIYSNKIKVDNQYGLYATQDGDFLSLSVYYKEIQKINKVKLITKYKEIVGLKEFKREFLQNGDYEQLLINKVPIKIIRDDNFGELSYYGISFRIVVGG